MILTGGSAIPRQELAHCMNHFAARHSLQDRLRIAIGPVVYDRMEVSASYQQACDLLQAWPGASGDTVWSCSGIGSRPGPSPQIDTGSLSPVVARSLDYIREHFAEGVSIKEFCAQVNVNASYLGYLFKKETGMFFNHYLNECRMEKAMELLVHSGEKRTERYQHGIPRGICFRRWKAGPDGLRNVLNVFSNSDLGKNTKMRFWY